MMGNEIKEAVAEAVTETIRAQRAIVSFESLVEDSVKFSRFVGAEYTQRAVDVIAGTEAPDEYFEMAIKYCELMKEISRQVLRHRRAEGN